MGWTVTAIRGLEPIPAAFAPEVGRALDKSPADRTANRDRRALALRFTPKVNLDMDIRPPPNMSGLWEEAAEPMQNTTHLLFPNSLRVFVAYFFLVLFQIYDSALRLRHDYFTRTKCEFFWGEDNKSGDESSQWEGGVELMGLGL